MSVPKRWRLGVNAALYGATKTCLNWYQRQDPALNNEGRDLLAPPSGPTRAIIDPDDGTAAGSSQSTGDQASLDSDSSRENVADSDLDTTSGDCVSYSDTDEVSIQTTYKKYQCRVRASCKLSKYSLWTEAQLKRINNSCQDIWGHDHESVRSEQKHALVEDYNSFEMPKMMVRTDQLLSIAEVTGSKIHTGESKAKTHVRVKNLVLSLKQYHTHYY